VMLGDGDPVEADLVGELELVERGVHRAFAELGRVLAGGGRPAGRRRWTGIANGNEQGSFHGGGL